MIIVINIFTINKGIEDGISKGMGVIEKNGVVGVVGKVGRYFSSVIPLMNVRSSISVVVEKNGALGSLVWNGDNPKRMLLEGIPKHIQFELRDRIVTSGYSLFPRGVVVGEIVSFNIKFPKKPTVRVNNSNVLNKEAKMFLAEAKIGESVMIFGLKSSGSDLKSHPVRFDIVK